MLHTFLYNFEGKWQIIFKKILVCIVSTSVKKKKSIGIMLSRIPFILKVILNSFVHSIFKVEPNLSLLLKDLYSKGWALVCICQGGHENYITVYR